MSGGHVPHTTTSSSSARPWSSSYRGGATETPSLFYEDYVTPAWIQEHVCDDHRCLAARWLRDPAAFEDRTAYWVPANPLNADDVRVYSSPHRDHHHHHYHDDVIAPPPVYQIYDDGRAFRSPLRRCMRHSRRGGRGGSAGVYSSTAGVVARTRASKATVNRLAVPRGGRGGGYRSGRGGRSVTSRQPHRSGVSASTSFASKTTVLPGRQMTPGEVYYFSANSHVLCVTRSNDSNLPTAAATPVTATAPPSPQQQVTSAGNCSCRRLRPWQHVRCSPPAPRLLHIEQEIFYEYVFFPFCSQGKTAVAVIFLSVFYASRNVL